MPMAKKQKVQKENGERWLLTYSDLITLLMIFFIILYAMSSTNTRKYNDLTGALSKAFNNGDFQLITPGGTAGTPRGGTSAAASQATLLQRVKSEVMQLDKELGISQKVLFVGKQRDGVQITVAGTLLFWPGYTQLRPASQVLIGRLAQLLIRMPNAIRVSANTDNQPSTNTQYTSNWELSSVRADAVVEGLASYGLAPSRLFALGQSQYHPVASNATSAGRELNRRADILIVYPIVK